MTKKNKKPDALLTPYEKNILQEQKNILQELKQLQENQLAANQVLAVHGQAIEKLIKEPKTAPGGGLNLKELTPIITEGITALKDYLLKTGEEKTSEGYKEWMESLRNNALKQSGFATRKMELEVEGIAKKLERGNPFD